MKILYIHNDYIRRSGEEIAAESLAQLLEGHDHRVKFFRRSSAELHGLPGKIKAFFSGINNPRAARDVAREMDEFKPDLVQIQNLYPLLSPAIFAPLRQRNVPVVMRCPNYRLFCPNGLCYDYRTDEVCEACFGGQEWNCVRRNCEENYFKSLGYTLRCRTARRSGRILNGVDMFIVQTEFQKQKFISQGIEAARIGIVPGIMPDIQSSPWTPGNTVTFIGRVSKEKGIDEFLECARLLPEIPFAVAGSCDGMPDVVKRSPPNVQWHGFQSGEALRQIYLNARMIVVPSRCYEGFPNVIVMAMRLKKPAIAAAHGSMSTIITHERNGMLFVPGDAVDLTEKVKSLYHDSVRCRKFGEAGSEDAELLYSREAIYQTLMTIYRDAYSRHGQNFPER